MDMQVICNSCGLRHYRRTECSARFAECFKCRQVGHFGRVCTRVSRLTGRVDLDPHRKQQRDRARMTAFLNRKDAMNLPFYGLTESEVEGLGFNSSTYKTKFNVASSSATVSQDEIMCLRTCLDLQIQAMECYRQDTEEELATVKSQLSETHDHNTYLRSTLRKSDGNERHFKAELSKTIADLKEEKETTSRLEAENASLMKNGSDCETLKSTITELQRLVADLKYQLSVRKDEIDELRQQVIPDLQNDVLIAEDQHDMRCKEIVNLQTRLKAVKTELLVNATSAIPEGVHSRSGKQHSYCRKCGSLDDKHTRRLCWAQDNKCQLCMKKGHFTVLCTS